MAEGIVKDGIYIKEINKKATRKGIVIVCKYVENSVEKSVRDNQRPVERFEEILKELKFTGIRNLELPEFLIERIIITGIELKWKDEELKECKLLGLYKAPHSIPIETKFYS